eukprot:TRINITY_DN4434_c0_g1_i2.p1 TRINITY_DN4434_c0_g1~~TRINITY_DN4434_c0_g1_i2.p1  ORF type:complete len:142 (-),score=37.04 TRINITY_DN4434_c0_g1_i2:141-566(-)
MRVQSKGLFNFQPKGVYDEDVAALNAARRKMTKELTGSETISISDDMEPEANALIARNYMAGAFAKMAEHPTYEKVVAGCDHEELTIPIRDGNNSEVKVLVHTPKTLERKQQQDSSGVCTWWRGHIWDCRDVQTNGVCSGL